MVNYTSNIPENCKQEDLHAKELALKLSENDNYRVLHRLVPKTIFNEPDGRVLSKGIIVDTEITGLINETDKIIEISLILFEYDSESGVIYSILDTYDSLEDPGVPIPESITEITGLTDEAVKGKRIDDSLVDAILDGVSIVIAHNSGFDRPFLEKRFPIFEQMQLGCSYIQVDWDKEGFGTKKLDYIAFKYGFFFDAHRADMDCQALLYLLQQKLPKSGSLVMKALTDKLTEKDYKISAVKSPFETKDILKTRKYKWDGERKSWHITVSGKEAVKAEVNWLKVNIYHKERVFLEFENREAVFKYSNREVEIIGREV